MVGPLHPCPPQAPRWIGTIPLAGSDTTPAGSNNGDNMDIEGGGHSHWQQQLAPKDPILDADLADTERTVTQSPVLLRNDGDGPSRWMVHAAPKDLVVDETQNVQMSVQTVIGATKRLYVPVVIERLPMFSAVVPKPTVKSVIIGPSAPKEPMITVIPSLLKEQVLNFIPVIPFPAPF